MPMVIDWSSGPANAGTVMAVLADKAAQRPRMRGKLRNSIMRLTSSGFGGHGTRRLALRAAVGETGQVRLDGARRDRRDDGPRDRLVGAAEMHRALQHEDRHVF